MSLTLVIESIWQMSQDWLRLEGTIVIFLALDSITVDSILRQCNCDVEICSLNKLPSYRKTERTECVLVMNRSLQHLPDELDEYFQFVSQPSLNT